MIVKRNRVFLFSLIVLTLTFGCNLFSGDKSESELPVQATRIEPTDKGS